MSEHKRTTDDYINRELSWLEFNHRVLGEARDPAVPLLERVKFLAITSSNLDEFMMVRVGGLQLLVSQGVTSRDSSGLSPAQQLDAIGRRVRQMVEDQYGCYEHELTPLLASAGIRHISFDEMNAEQQEHAQRVFEEEVFPQLTPRAVEPTAVFPLLMNLALRLAVRLKPDARRGGDASRFAFVALGKRLNRFITLPASAGRYEYLLLEDLVAYFIDRLFPGEEVLECATFRITLNADLSVREDLAADLLEQMQEVLEARKRSDCVRLEIDACASEELSAFLCESLSLKASDMFRIAGPLDFADFMALAGLSGFDALKNELWPAQPCPLLEPGRSLFESIGERDILLYHPYDSFEPVQRLVEEAADDPDVLAIKQILYRTSRDSPIVAALMRAAQQGKYVTAVVELKARFDEARNMEWARALEQEGVQVIYGVRGLKTHAKCCLVVRRESQGLRRYLHFGTGNYNEVTARVYSDASYLSADADLGADASQFFNAITGYSEPQTFRKLDMAPIGLRDKIVELIRGETERKKEGQPALIMAKVNSLVDARIIESLYEASQAGVDIRLNVRGICCLKPGVAGLSENIRVVSIIDRFLEHARILYFRHGGEEKLLISSADWMPRNLNRRVELLTPVEDSECKQKLIDILHICFADNVKAHELGPDGRYRHLKPEGRPAVRCQLRFHEMALDANRRVTQRRRTVFQPHRPVS